MTFLSPPATILDGNSALTRIEVVICVLSPAVTAIVGCVCSAEAVAGVVVNVTFVLELVDPAVQISLISVGPITDSGAK